MTSVTELVEISNQQKFIDFLMDILEGKKDFPANVKFKDWPRIELNINKWGQSKLKIVSYTL
ncbi:MAG: hypothetical protein ACJAS1_006284 [Oleiphilaceae bacterium]|jgi:hypothetical protein